MDCLLLEEEGYKGNIREKTGQRVCEIGGLGTGEIVHWQGDWDGKVRVKVGDCGRRIGVGSFWERGIGQCERRQHNIVEQMEQVEQI